MKRFLSFLLYLWQLPQNLLGLTLILIYRKERVFHRLNGRVFYCTPEMPCGISLGRYIILKREGYGNGFRHEYGHSIQSACFGPFYLIAVGLPSLLGNIIDRMFHTEKRGWTAEQSIRWYYSLPWEMSADELGGVERWK